MGAGSGAGGGAAELVGRASASRPRPRPHRAPAVSRFQPAAQVPAGGSAPVRPGPAPPRVPPARRSPAPTDGRTDARTRGPAGGGAGREEQVSAPRGPGPSATDPRYDPAGSLPALRRRRDAGAAPMDGGLARASVSPGGGATRGSARVCGPGQGVGRHWARWGCAGSAGRPWARRQEPGPSEARPGPSGPGAAPVRRDIFKSMLMSQPAPSQPCARWGGPRFLPCAGRPHLSIPGAGWAFPGVRPLR